MNHLLLAPPIWPLPPNPPLEGTVRADVAIIGAGYTGLATALNLHIDSPLNVVVLGRTWWATAPAAETAGSI
jgi:glycine/D-amino acid oxidase-like deaminating enzyme